MGLTPRPLLAPGWLLMAAIMALANAIASRGDNCRAYPRTTNALLPGPPRARGDGTT